MQGNWPIVLIEGVLVFGGALLFGWWQLRSIKRDQQKAREERERAGREAAQGTDAGDSARNPPP